MKECAYCNSCFEDDVKTCPKDNQPLIDSFAGSRVLDTKYLLETCIGRGGMGAVYRAKHVHLNRPFAIKTVLPEFASRDPQAKERFLQEAQAAAAIQHPSVVAITDFGVTSDKLFYYVMEYIEGKSLSEELRKHGAMSPERTYKIFKQVLAGVGAAHRLHMVHRDLKPSNIMLTTISNPQDDFKVLIPLNDEPEDSKAMDNELAKVVDFGLARFINSAVGRGADLQEGGLVGSPLYMSPEQCEEASSVDERSDIYSLGVILYHMLTGEVPFKGSSLTAILSAHLLKEPPPLRSIKGEIPEKIRESSLKNASEKPNLRYQSISEFAEDFESAMSVYLTPEAQKLNVIMQTIPPACEVYIDDEYRGRTGPEGKLVIKGLTAGTHQARVILKGYLEWSQSFSAASGDFNLKATLQRKEDVELAKAKPSTKPIAKKPIGSASTSEVADSVYYRSIPNQPAELSYLNAFLAVLATLATLGMVNIFEHIDPLSASISQRISIPIEPLMSSMVILTVIVFNISVLIPDTLPSYRNSIPLGRMFNFASLLLVVIIIFPLLVGIIFKFSGDTNLAPPIAWFGMRALIIVCCLLLQQRVKSKGKVGFLI
ncbi:MAG: serine/threonine protein kinase [Blastocatellia bacterium]|nr:serine/threonine protein kinase [Blastocatellia bacterium]